MKSRSRNRVKFRIQKLIDPQILWTSLVILGFLGLILFYPRAREAHLMTPSGGEPNRTLSSSNQFEASPFKMD